MKEEIIHLRHGNGCRFIMLYFIITLNYGFGRSSPTPSCVLRGGIRQNYL